MALTKEQILAAQDRKTKTVDVPEWGGQVFVRSLTASERDTYEVGVAEDRKQRQDNPLHKVNMRARLAALTVCDEKGQRLFADIDAVELAKKNASVVDRIFDAAIELNAMGATAREVATKNSETGQNVASPSS